jgi:hypothetical protein
VERTIPDRASLSFSHPQPPDQEDASLLIRRAGRAGSTAGETHCRYVTRLAPSTYLSKVRA